MKKMFKIKKPIHFIYLLSLVGMLFVVFLITSTRTYQDSFYDSMNNFMDVSELFKIEPNGTDNVNFRKLGSYCTEGQENLNLYFCIPELTKDATLIFRTKDVYAKVFIDDVLIYQTNVADGKYYNRSPGNIWNKVFIDELDSGKMLRLQLDVVYDINAITADHFFLGEGASIVSYIVKNKMVAIIVSFAMILVGIFMIFIDLNSRHHTSITKHGLLYLGIYALLVGIWSLLETNVVQFFVADQRIIQVMNNMIMIVDSLPLFLYLDCEYELFKHKPIKWMCCLNLGYIIVCLFTQILGIADFHELLIGAHIALIFNSILFFGWIVLTAIRFKGEKDDRVAIFFQVTGMGALFFSAIIEFVKYKEGDFSDRAGFIRIGILIFVILYGIGNQIQAGRLMRRGLKYEVIRKLAYRDGLTSVENRTAYLEKIEAYSKSNQEQMGIVFLDINDLKKVNDNYGHETGDLLIVEASKLIKNSFGLYGNTYRIGGDEFCVVFDDNEGHDLNKTYEEAANIFFKKVEEINEKQILPINLMIAHGFSICKGTDNEKIQSAISEADHSMYKNKALLKKI